MDKARILSKSVEEVLPSKDGLEKLMAKRKIKVYLGVDPTGSKLHIGHSIPLRKLQEFADLGHEAILVIGTGTVIAGDPSQRLQARSKIEKGEIEQNIKNWQKQAGKILDFEKVQIKYNDDWLLKLKTTDILEIASNISAKQLIKREMFQDRTNKGDTVWMNEVLYPILQGYDSVALNVDLEIGGTDQVFNMLTGRELQKKINDKEKYVLTTPLISGTDGNPMSKTSNNCIWLDDSPNEMYAKLMSISDNQIGKYAKTLTDLDLGPNPLDAKKKLAFGIVKLFNSTQEAEKAQENWESTFQKKQSPQDLESIAVKSTSVDIVNLLVENNLAPSNSEAKRLLSQKALELGGEKVTEQKIKVENGQVLKIGKKKFVKITTK